MDDLKHTERLEAEIDADVISAVREIARQQGRDINSLVDEALSDFVQKKARGSAAQPDMLAAHRQIIERYHDVFKKLAE